MIEILSILKFIKVLTQSLQLKFQDDSLEATPSYTILHLPGNDLIVLQKLRINQGVIHLQSKEKKVCKLTKRSFERFYLTLDMN